MQCGFVRECGFPFKPSMGKLEIIVLNALIRQSSRVPRSMFEKFGIGRGMDDKL